MIGNDDGLLPDLDPSEILTHYWRWDEDTTQCQELNRLKNMLHQFHKQNMMQQKTKKDELLGRKDN